MLGGTDESADAMAEKDITVPRTIVAKGSKVSSYVAELIKDLRKLMSPYTATNLRERRCVSEEQKHTCTDNETN